MKKPRTVSIGAQGFEDIREHDYFLVDKSLFIREWWENGDKVTLITRPRRFGKTLNMSMTECFFSTRYEARADLFEGLKIWEDEDYRALQGTYPVISISFSSLKFSNMHDMYSGVTGLIQDLYSRFRFLTEDERMNDEDRKQFGSVVRGMLLRNR